MYGIVKKIHERNISRERIKTLPEFSFKTLNGSIFKSDQIKEGPVLILFFNPECEHCQYQITSLFKNVALPKELNVLLISNSEPRPIMKFLKDNNLSEYPELTVMIDETFKFRECFGTDIVPATFIYNKDLKLVKYYKGEVNPETILKCLRQND
jgi:thiol-disulfide isomerase/thioredoxin